MRSTVCQRNSSNTSLYHLLQTLETFMSSRRHRQEKIPNSSSSGRKSQETPGKFSRFSLGLQTITKSLSFTLLFSCFRGGLCGLLRFERSSWEMFSLSTSFFSRAAPATKAATRRWPPCFSLSLTPLFTLHTAHAHRCPEHSRGGQCITFGV